MPGKKKTKPVAIQIHDKKLEEAWIKSEGPRLERVRKAIDKNTAEQARNYERYWRHEGRRQSNH